MDNKCNEMQNLVLYRVEIMKDDKMQVILVEAENEKDASYKAHIILE